VTVEGETAVEKRLVVITGNGLSRACSEAFDIKTLSAKLRDQLEQDDVLGKAGLEVADGLASYLDRSGDGGEPGFEQLVGAFDSLRRSMELLGELKKAQSPLADAVGPGELEDVAAFCDRVYRRGTSIALKLIDDAATAARGSRVPTELVKLIKNDVTDHVTYATLNYDTLLLGAILDVHRSTSFADLGCDGKVAPIRETEQAEVEAFFLTNGDSKKAIATRPPRRPHRRSRQRPVTRQG
jgi:hypothetical protein